jgi:hypothetical protein
VVAKKNLISTANVVLSYHAPEELNSWRSDNFVGLQLVNQEIKLRFERMQRTWLREDKSINFHRVERKELGIGLHTYKNALKTFTSFITKRDDWLE